MPGSVDQIQLEFPPVYTVIHADWLHFDGYAALALKFHGIENLLLHFPRLHRLCDLKHSIGKSALAVIDVGDN